MAKEGMKEYRNQRIHFEPKDFKFVITGDVAGDGTIFAESMREAKDRIDRLLSFAKNAEFKADTLDLKVVLDDGREETITGINRSNRTFRGFAIDKWDDTKVYVRCPASFALLEEHRRLQSEIEHVEAGLRELLVDTPYGYGRMDDPVEYQAALKDLVSKYNEALARANQGE